jgi:hypothetical protein
MSTNVRTPGQPTASNYFGAVVLLDPATGVPLVPGGTGASATQVQGTVATSSPTVGNPVSVGGVVATATPADWVAGDRGELQFSTSGGVFVSIGNAGSQVQFSAVTDGQSGITALGARGMGQVWDGTSTWSNVRAISGLTTAGTGVQAVGLVGQFNTTPTALTNGQYGRAQLDANGYLLAVGGGFSPTNTFTATAATNYTAGAVIQGARTLANAGPNAGGRMVILGARLLIPITAVTSGMTSFTLQLYSVTPPSALANNTTWDLPSGDNASYLGSVALGTPVDLGSTLYVETFGINKPLTVPSGGSVFAYLVTTGAYTAAAAAYTVTLDLAVL